MWPMSCSRLAATSAGGAPSRSASHADCSACSSCVTGSPLYMRPPIEAYSAPISAMESVMLPAALPGYGIGFQIGEALAAFLYAFLVAQARILDAAERRHLEPVAGHLPDVHAADLQLPHEAHDVVHPVGAYAAREAVGRGVHQRDGLVDAAKGHHRRHRAKG